MLVGIVVLVAIALVGVRLVGFGIHGTFGSMEPAYHVGSLSMLGVDYDLKEKM